MSHSPSYTHIILCLFYFHILFFFYYLKSSFFIIILFILYRNFVSISGKVRSSSCIDHSTDEDNWTRNITLPSITLFVYFYFFLILLLVNMNSHLIFFLFLYFIFLMRNENNNLYIYSVYSCCKFLILCFFYITFNRSHLFIDVWSQFFIRYMILIFIKYLNLIDNLLISPKLYLNSKFIYKGIPYIVSHQRIKCHHLWCGSEISFTDLWNKFPR